MASYIISRRPVDGVVFLGKLHSITECILGQSMSRKKPGLIFKGTGSSYLGSLEDGKTGVLPYNAK